MTYKFYDEKFAQELRRVMELDPGAPTFELFVLDELGRPTFLVPDGKRVIDITDRPISETDRLAENVGVVNIESASWVITNSDRACYTRSNGRKYCCED